MVSPLICLVLLSVAVFNTVAGSVMLTSTVEESGRQFACDGELVTFTCQVVGSATFMWDGSLLSPVIFDFTSPQQSIPRPPFIITLASVAGSGIMSNFTSTLQVNASRTFVGTNTSVMCEKPSDSKESNFTVADIPGVPQNFAVNQVERVSDGRSVTIMASWMRPQNYGQFDIAHYNLNVSSTSGIQQVSLQENGDSTTAVLTVSENPNNVQLNTTFTVTITATSQCGETSSAATATHTLIDCGSPPAPRNGSLESFTSTTEGSVVFYSCDPGLVPVGRMMSVCTGSGWNPDLPGLNCSEVNCGRPSIHMNGSIVSISSTLGGGEVIFGCNPGFVPAGRMRANCTSDGITADGTWTPDPATLMCNASRVDCGNFTLVDGVDVEPYITTTVNSVIFYQCQQSGFAPSSTSSVCGEDEMWSPDPSRVMCDIVITTPTAGPTTAPTSEFPGSVPVLSDGAIAGIVIVLLVVVILAVAVVIVGVVWWRKRSNVTSKPEPPREDVAMYSVVDDSPVKPAPYKGYMLKGPEAEYSTVDEATSPTTSKAVEAQYDLPPGSNHPEGLVYAEVNVKPKSSAKPRVPKPDKTDDRVEYAAIAYQPKDAVEKSPPVVEPTSKRMALPDNPDDSVNLDNLLIQLKQVNSMWRELGDALGLPPSILDDISGQYQSDPQQCMVEMLDSWLMRHMHQGSPTWWEVAQALRQIARSDMADALETVYSTGVLPITVNMDAIPEGSLPTDTGSPPPIPVRGPLTDEPDYPPPKPPRGTPEKKAAPPRPPRGGSERKPK